MFADAVSLQDQLSSVANICEPADALGSRRSWFPADVWGTDPPMGDTGSTSTSGHRENERPAAVIRVFDVSRGDGSESSPVSFHGSPKVDFEPRYMCER
ncbi:hypothetical protein EYF80_014620 [Liparis tanakae]|uniref:Uncharacterized protein n=1 Tax=Liparis tanakae TaxID=230148 RepID=A0A4Z2IBE1_9TELE|nr:hypothetical protein EYF80_014620 [Liparis tanakae]